MPRFRRLPIAILAVSLLFGVVVAFAGEAQLPADAAGCEAFLDARMRWERAALREAGRDNSVDLDLGLADGNVHCVIGRLS